MHLWSVTGSSKLLHDHVGHQNKFPVELHIVGKLHQKHLAWIKPFVLMVPFLGVVWKPPILRVPRFKTTHRDPSSADLRGSPSLGAGGGGGCKPRGLLAMDRQRLGFSSAFC